MKYNSLLPREDKKKHRCQVILERGGRCKNLAIIETRFFGDETIYEKVNSVAVHLCKKHYEKLSE
jgi:hypothetical protein